MPTPFSAQHPTGFFAYAGTPHSIPATIKAAIESINKSQNATLTSWEALEIGGKYIIREICDKIDDCDFFCADITTMLQQQAAQLITELIEGISPQSDSSDSSC